MNLTFQASLNGGAGSFRLDVRLELPCRRLVLFGPSGSGKSLTLRAVAGLLRPETGRIEVGGRVLFDSGQGVDVPARRRKVGFLFQDYALFPHLTLEENLRFGLARFWRRPSSEAERRVSALLESFGLSEVAGHLPGELSGGQKQRAALARALAPAPELLLLDEPYSALDQPLRVKLRAELKKTLERFDTPLILVTHDPDEAVAFGEAVAVFGRGSVRRTLTAAELAAAPDSKALLLEGFDGL
ncbi:MAG TPA: ATP-binding cassette domain-containing protein [Desulfovibrio sp.]|jgi:ABC-type spermidine/putrescine transport systems, ATPase components|uniref:ATP-binding cassette domain-containing protein n=1 Tax=Desulfovibrio TaxID=872 RepID=UPI002A3F4371|nr:ATP-binding cassette domain-containing protein [Desulfovibrio sp.]MDY0307754.1 ATP-binding cassette domain-containing protein [Desulfovibrionaceae bacterium]HMM39234.1 ATP-binding cassette domain-containing protein [Desulfovibrio sp.]